MRLFRSIANQYWGKTSYRWSLTIPVEVVRALGWEHRDDFAYEIVDRELRIKRQCPRNYVRDMVPGGRVDPITGRIVIPPPRQP